MPSSRETTPRPGRTQVSTAAQGRITCSSVIPAGNGDGHQHALTGPINVYRGDTLFTQHPGAGIWNIDKGTVEWTMDDQTKCTWRVQTSSGNPSLFNREREVGTEQWVISGSLSRKCGQRFRALSPAPVPDRIVFEDYQVTGDASKFSLKGPVRIIKGGEVVAESSGDAGFSTSSGQLAFYDSESQAQKVWMLAKTDGVLDGLPPQASVAYGGLEMVGDLTDHTARWQ